MSTCNKFLAPNGEPSLLYAGLSQKYGDKKAAELWAWSKSEAFKDVEKTEQGEPSLSAVENKLAEFESKARDEEAYKQLQHVLENPAVAAIPKIINALQTPKIEQVYNKHFATNSGKFYQEVAAVAGKQQTEWLKDFVEREKPTSYGDLVTGLAAEMSYTVKIDTVEELNGEPLYYVEENFGLIPNTDEEAISHTVYRNASPIKSFNTKEEADSFINENQVNYKPTSHYSNLTVPGGTNYTENEISTTLITPSIKGHAQFSTDNGIGWFRSDDQIVNQNVEPILNSDPFGDLPLDATAKYSGGYTNNTRRILEVQSDLFQKGRDKKNLISHNEFDEYKESNFTADGKDYSTPGGGYFFENGETIDRYKFIAAYRKFEDTLKKDNSQNQFLQLLNKDNNWVTFFVKSIIQDSAKKGYEKVLFPSGNTASKIEGHTTLEEFKKQKEEEIERYTKMSNQVYIGINNPKQLLKNNLYVLGYSGITSENEKDFINKVTDFKKTIDRSLETYKEELKRVETEGFGALKPIYNFYENTVTNILKKQGFSPVLITDEYGNTWNEVSTIKGFEIISFNQDDQQITFQEEPSSGYKERTIKNASADATIAIAVDFSSAGEKLTKNSVEKQGKSYIPISVLGNLDVTEERINRVVDALNKVNAKTLNIAGNGIYTMQGRYTQEQVDEFTYNLLKAVIESSNLKTKIESIRTGGQTGFDEAGAKAGLRLGLPTIILAPKGWKFRNVHGIDISNEKAFKERFGNVTSKIQTAPVEEVKQPTSNPLQIDKSILAKDNDAKLVPIRDAAGKHTGQWFDYTSRQVPTVASMTLMFMQEYGRLAVDKDRQDAMVTMKVGPVDFIKSRIEATFKDRLNRVQQVADGKVTVPTAQFELATKLVNSYTEVLQSFSTADNNGFWDYTVRQLELNGIKFNNDGTIDEHESNLKSIEDEIENELDENGIEHLERTQQDWQINNDSINLLNKAGVKLKGLFMGVPECEFRMSVAPAEVRIPISSEIARNMLAKGTKKDLHISATIAAERGLKIGVPFSVKLTSNNDTVLVVTPMKTVDVETLESRQSDVESIEGHTLKIGDIQARVEIFHSQQIVAPKQNYLIFPQSADQKDLWTKVQSILVDTTPSAEKMIEALKNTDNANVQYLAKVLSDTKQTKGEVLKDLVKVFSAQTKKQLLVTYTKGRDGHLSFRVIDSNQNNEVKSIVKYWQEQQKTAEILKLNDAGQYAIDKNLALGLHEELQKIYRDKATEEWKKSFFKTVLEVNGIILNGRAIDTLMDGKKFDAIRKKIGIKEGLISVYAGTTQNNSALGLIDALVGRMANKIINSQEKVEGDEFEDTTDKWMDNNPLYVEGTVMRMLATAELPYSEIKFSTTHKNANGDGVQSTGMNTALSHTIRKLKTNEGNFRSRIEGDDFRKTSWVWKQLKADVNRFNGISISYDDAIKNQYGGAVVRTDMSPREEWAFRLGLYSTGGNSENVARDTTASYLSLTHSDKTTSPIFSNFPRLEAAYTLAWDGSEFSVHPKAIDIIYNSIFLAEYNRMTYSKGSEINNYEVGKKLFYLIPLLNKEILKQEIGKSITQQEYNVIWNNYNGINPITTTLNGVSMESAVKKVIGVFMAKKVEATLKDWKDTKLDEVGVVGSKYAVGKLLDIANAPDKIPTALKNQTIAIDFMVNDFLNSTGITQMIFGDPAQFIKVKKDDLIETKNEVTGESIFTVKPEREVVVIQATMAEYTKRMAGPIAPGLDSDMTHATNKEHYVSICASDYTPVIKELKQAGIKWNSNATDAQQFARMEHWLNEAYGQTLISQEQFTKCLDIINASKGGFYSFKEVAGMEDKIYHLDMNPAKPVLYGMNESSTGGVSRTDYGKTSTFYLYPPMVVGMEIDKVRIAMERGGVDTIDFISNRKTGAPSKQINLFTADGRVDENIFNSDEWKTDARQQLRRDNVRYQQEIHAHEDVSEEKFSTQAHENVRDGLPNMSEDIKFDVGVGKLMTGKEVRRYMEDTTVAIVNINHGKFLKSIGAKLNENNDPEWSDIKKVFTDLANYTKQQAGFRSDDYTSLIDFVPGTSQLNVPFWLNKSSSKLEMKMFAQLNAVKDLIMPGKAFVQISPAGIQTGLNYWEDGKYSESEIIWVTKFEGELNTAQLTDEGKTVKPAQVIVSQDYFAKTGLNLQDYITTVDGKQMLDMERFPQELLQLVGVRIPNQGHVSMLPIEIVGFMPSTIKSSIIVPAAITKQMGGDFDVDKLFTYRRGFKVNKNGIQLHTAEREENRLKIAFLRDWQGEEGTNEELLAKEFTAEELEGFNSYIKLEAKPNMDTLKTKYFNIHWGILTNPAIYPKMMAELDQNDLSDEKSKYDIENAGRIDFFDAGTQNKLRQDLADAKVGVGTSALEATHEVKLQDKNISLVSLQKTREGIALMPASITVLDNEGNQRNLEFLSGFGEGEYDDGKSKKRRRTKGNTIQIVMGAAVDNGKDRNFTDAKLNRHVSNAGAAMRKLQTLDTAAGPGWITTADFHVGLFQQPIIREYVAAMGTENDGLSKKFDPNVKDKIIADLKAKYRAMATLGATAEQMEQLHEIMDSHLFSAKDLEETAKMEDSRTKFAKQVAAMQLFEQFDSVGKQIVGAQSALSQNTRGAGKNMLSALSTQNKINRFDTPSKKDSKILYGLADVFQHEDGTENELGAFKRTTIDTALKLFGNILPIAKMESMFQIVHNLTNDEGTDASEKTKVLVKGAIENFANSHKWLGIFSSTAAEERIRLMTGKNSLARKLHAAQQTWAKEDPFLRPERLVAELSLDGGPDTISYQAFGMTPAQEIEGQTSLTNLLASTDENKRALGGDLIRYIYATGGKQNARNYMKFIGHSVIAGSSIAEGQRVFTQHLENVLDKRFLEQFLQHNPDKAPQLSENLGELGVEKLATEFTLPYVPTEELSNLYALESDGDGGFNKVYKEYISFKDNSKLGKNKWRLFKKGKSVEGGKVNFTEIDVLGSKSKQILEYSGDNNDVVRSVFPENKVITPAVKEMKGAATSLAMQSVGLTSVEGNGKALMTSLEVISNDSEQPSYLREVAALLSNSRTTAEDVVFNQVLGLTVPLTYKVVDRLSNNAAARFNSIDNLLSLSGTISNGNKTVLAENIVHEMLHYNSSLLLNAYEFFKNGMEINGKNRATLEKLVAYLHENPNVVASIKEFNEIFEEAKKRYEESSDKTQRLDYAFSNSREFMSHIFSNAETMKWLNKQEYTGKKSLLEKIQDIFAKIWDSIAKTFGANEGSLLEESIKRGLNLIAADRITKYDYENSTTPDITRADDGTFSTGNIIVSLTTNEKAAAKLKENLSLLKLSLSGQLDSKQREERKGKIEELEEHIKRLSDEASPNDTVNAIGEQWVRYIERVSKFNEPTSNELATALYLADTWRGMKELLLGTEYSTDELRAISDRASAAYQRLLGRSSQWLEVSFKLGEDEFNNSLKDENAAEAWLRALATSDGPMAKVGTEMKTLADQEDEEAKRVVQSLDELSKDINEEYGKGSHKNLLKSFIDPGTGRLKLQFTQHWFSTIHELRKKRNGQIWYTEKAEGATQESIDMAQLKAWQNFRKEIEKVGVYIDVNRILDTNPTSSNLGKEREDIRDYILHLRDQIGAENVDNAIRIATEKYQKFLKQYEDHAAYLDSRLEPLTSEGKPILAEADRVAQDYLTAEEIEKAKLKMRNIYSPAVITSTSDQRSLIAAKDDYVHLVPKVSETGMWDEGFKDIMADAKKREFYDRLNDLKLDLQRMYPIDNVQSRIPGFMPIVHKNMTTGNMGFIESLQQKIKDFNENLTKKLTASEFQALMNTAAYKDKIPTPFVNEQDVDSADRSDDILSNMKLFAIAAVHHKHASAAKDMIALVKAKIYDIQRARLAGNVQEEVNGKVLTNSQALTNLLNTIKHLEDTLIYLRPKKLEINTGGKFYAENVYGINEVGDRVLLKRKFSNPLNPFTHIGLLGGAQAKAAKEVEAIMIERTKLIDDFTQHLLGETDDENQKAYDAGMIVIEGKLSKYSQYNIYGSKIGDWMMEVQSKKALGFNPFSAFNNVSFGLISTYIHAAGGVDFNRKEVNKAWIMMMGALRNKETAKKIHAVMDRLGVIGEFIDLKYGKSPELKAEAIQKYMDPFYLMRESDFFMKGVSTLATLFHYQTDTNQGKISVWDTLTTEGKWDAEKFGEDKLWYDETSTMGVNKWNALRQYVARVNMVLHGNQDKNSPMMHKGFMLGRLLGQFRSSWLIEGFANRFQSEREDQALGRTVKGRYRTFQAMGAGNSITTVFKSVFNAILSKLPFGTIDATQGVYVKTIGKNGIERRIPITDSAVDMENLKRNVAEVNFYLVLSAVVMLLKGLKGDKDDDDTPILNAFTTLAINMGVRSRQDINLYASPGVFDQVFRNPIPAFDAAKDFSKMIKYSTTGWLDYNYQDGFSIDEDFNLEKWLKKVAKGNLIIPEAALIPKIEYMITKDLDKLQ